MTHPENPTPHRNESPPPAPRRGADRWLALGASLIGGVSLLAGAGYGLEAMWRAEIVGPAHAATAALLLGLAAMLAGDRMWRDRWAPTAAALSGAGMGTLYLTLFVCYGTFGWLSSGVATVLLLLVTLAGVLQAVRRDSQLMACLGLAGGLATPLVVGALAPEAAPYQALTVVVDLAVAGALTRRRWPVLAWLATLGTSAIWAAGVSWGVALVPVVVAAAIVGGAFALTAQRVEEGVAVPLGLGVGVALLAALGTVTVAPVGAMAVTTGLLVLGRHLCAERDWTVGRLWLPGAVATLLTLAGVVAVFAGSVAPAMAMVLWTLPAVALWVSAAWDGHPDHHEGLIVATSSVVVAITAALLPGQAQFAPLALLGTGLPLLALRWTAGRPTPGRAWYATVLPALTGAAAAAGLATEASALPLALGGLGACLLLPMAIGDRDDLRTYLPMVAAVPWLGAATWQVAEVLPAVTGLPALLAGLVTLAVQQRQAPESIGHRAYQGATVALAALAVPLQLEREAWTLGWALLAAGLAWTVRGRRAPALQTTALVLAGLVTARLTLNPSVLSYHLSAGTPSLWVLYGYGVPLVCLVAMERWVTRGRPWLQAMAAGVAFAGVNVLVSQLFHGTGALQLVDMTLHARVARTVSWGALGLGMLGVAGRWPLLRHIGIASLCAVVGKVVLFDLWALPGASRAALLGGVAVCFLAAAGLLQRRQPSPRTATGLS